METMEESGEDRGYVEEIMIWGDRGSKKDSARGETEGERGKLTFKGDRVQRDVGREIVGG